MVESHINLDAFSGHLYVFCNRVKINMKGIDTGTGTGLIYGRRALRR
jgi:hypothetical protein